MKFTEEQLRLAAKRVDERLLAGLPDETECINYEFSDSFEQKMNTLIEQVKNNEISPAKVAMGWQYYTRNGLVAILLCFLLACITMPNVVLAGYQKLINVIETVVTEYTEYRYESSERSDALFVPVKFGYLPDGMEVVKYRETETSIHTLMRNENHYFNLDQRLLTIEDGLTYIFDTEDAETEFLFIQHEEIQLILKDKIYSYVWLHGAYQITGQSDLPRDEIIKILETVKIENEISK